MKKTIGGLSALLVLVASGCSDDDDPPLTRGERFCRALVNCPNFEIVDTPEECARQFDQEWVPNLTGSCVSCLETLTCEQWERAGGDPIGSGHCPECGSQ